MTIPDALVLVSLSDAEMAVAQFVARLRNDRKVAAGVKSLKYLAHETDGDVHLWGVRAELAVAKALNVYPSLWASLTGDRGNGGDLHMFGLTVEVKYRRMAGWAFLLPEGDAELRSDVGVLVWPSGAHGRGFLIAGWISQAGFSRHKQRYDFGHGLRFGVEACHMRDLYTLEQSAVYGILEVENA